MIKKLSFVFVLLLWGWSGWCHPVDLSLARRVGSAFLTSMGHPHADSLARVDVPFVQFYVFNSGPTGFVIISADDCVRPVLGYSLNNTFRPGAMPTNVHGWLEDYENEIIMAKQLELEGKLHTGDNLGASTSVAEEWRRLTAGAAVEPLLSVGVSPLITTTWNQSPWYNELCPYDETYEERVVTGCVATATAQIMKYWNHPTTGTGSHGYQTRYGYLSADFGATTYDWDNMPSELSSTSSLEEITAVATLMYHIGVAVEMDYDVSALGGSGAYNHYDARHPSAENALKNYFKYSQNTTVLWRSSSDIASYCQSLRDELSLNRPILYDGSGNSGGHSFVMDGYDQYGNFHINWGWGGYYDGYYAIGALNPTEPGSSDWTFNSNNTALIGIEPLCTVAVNAVGGDAACAVSGGGTYNIGETATISATAGEGYRFEEWNDLDYSNPRSFTLDNYENNITARFVTLGNDMMSYCGNKEYSHLSAGVDGEGSDRYWGIRLPASSFSAVSQLKAVDFYAVEAGQYDVTVYKGVSEPSETVFSSTVQVGSVDLNGWVSVNLNPLYVVESDKSVWITIHNTDAQHPVAVTASSGNPDGFLWGPDFAPSSYWSEHSLMIRGRFNSTRHEIVVESSDTLKGIVSGGGIYSHGAMATLTATPATTYHFVQWTDGNTDNPRTVSVTSDTVFTAEFSINQYNVTVSSSNDASGAVSGGGTYEHGASASLTATPSICHHFTQWADGNTDNPRTVTVTSDTAFTAEFGTNQYAITVGNEGSYGTVTGNGIYNCGDIVTLSASPATGYHFTQWNDGNTDNPRMVTVSGNATYIAEFSINQYSLTVSCNITNRGTVTGGGIYDYNTTATLTAIPETGFHFLRWNDGGTDNPRVVTVAADTSFTAIFVYNQYTVSAVPNDASMGSVTGGGVFTYKTYDTIEAIAAYGYHFLQWNDGNTDNPRRFQVVWDTFFFAIFSANQYNVVAVSDNSEFGTVTGGGEFNYRTNATLTATAATGYRFVQWQDGNTDNPRQILVTRDTAFSAQFAINPFVLTVLSADETMGTVVGGGEYNYNTTATIKAIPREGCRFVQWNDGNTSNPRTVTVTGNATYTAEFALITYLVAVASEDESMGSVTGGGMYVINTFGTIEAVPMYGYHFVQWQDGNTDNPRQILVTRDTAFTAQFAINQYSITAKANDPSRGSATGSGSYDYNTVVTIEAFGAAGFQFSHWNDGDTDNPRDVIVVEDATYIAYFRQSHGISDVEDDELIVVSRDGKVTVTGVEGRLVTLTDATGRILYRGIATEPLTVEVPTSGVYLLQVDGHPTRRISVVR